MRAKSAGDLFSVSVLVQIIDKGKQNRGRSAH
jgi:hypothetical protein